MTTDKFLRQLGRATSRRALLKSLGAGTALVPFLPLLNATGQEGLFPLRLLLVYTPDGTAADAANGNAAVDWKPTGTETDFTLRPTHAALEPFKSKIVVPWGLDATVGGAGEPHAFGMAGLWTASELHGPEAGADFDGGNGNRTGWGSAASIDQIVADAVGPGSPYQSARDAALQDTPYRTLELGVQTNNPTSLTRMIYAGDKTPIHPEVNALNAFNRVFAGVSTQSADTGVADRLLREQRSILDSVNADLTKLRPRISAEEYFKLDAHLEGLRAIEGRLGTTVQAGAGCSVPGAPPAPVTGRGAANANFPIEVTTTIDLIKSIFACDLTRVASLQLSVGFSNVTHAWLGQTRGHHSMSHDGSTSRVNELSAIDGWYAEQVAYLLGALDSVPEGNGTMLDNTLVVWGRELGSTSHALRPFPVLLAGGARGGLATGRFLDVDSEPHVKVLVSVAQLMGIDTQSIGNLEPNSGPLALL